MKLVFDHINVTKIGNGGVKSRQMAQEMMEKTGCESVIISSAALKNPTVFSKTHVEKNPLLLARRYIDIAIEHGCSDKHEWSWHVTTMLGKYRHVTRSPDYEPMTRIKDLQEMHDFLYRDGIFPMPTTGLNDDSDDE